tara:strand:- start:2746 stop:2955 length:210 start_codon:yes stop_codon:yes gene_type:complete
MKKARSEFEVFIRTQGISKRKFGQITGNKGSTIEKYLANPSLLRVKHLRCLVESDECDKSMIEIIKLIK